MSRTNLIALAALLLAVSASAQSPYLVTDLNTSTPSQTYSSSPFGFTAINDKILFSALTQAAGQEPWQLSGGVASMLVDIKAGTGSGLASGFWPTANGLVFNGSSHSQGNELWRTDGTAAGTVLVKDIHPTASSAISPRTTFGNRVLFMANDGVHGSEPWITDGTEAGTRMLVDLDGTSASTATTIIAGSDRVFIFARGRLWVSDGTPEGTTLLDPPVAFPRSVTAVGSVIYFTATTASTGRELWKSDGTSAGTVMVTDLIAGGTGGFDESSVRLAAFNGKLYFLSRSPAALENLDLGVTDGTAAGTKIVKTGIALVNDFPWLTTAGSLLYVTGESLWRSDGTPAGTSLLLADQSTTGITAAFGKAFFFRSSDEWVNAELWSTDGTPGGTALVKALAGTTTSATFVGGKLYFRAATSLHGTELWVSDGTPAGTHELMNINPDPAPSSGANQLTAAGNLVYFTGTDGIVKTTQLYRSDGTAGGTFRLTQLGDQWNSPYLTLFTGWRGALYFRETKLWRSDGTVAGTAAMNSITAEEAFPGTSWLYLEGNNGSSSSGTALRSDGTEGGTISLSPSNYLYDQPDEPDGFAELAGRVYTLANYYDPGLFGLGSTAAETKRIITLGRYEDAMTTLVSGAGALFFGRETHDHGVELWRSDGTVDGTRLVKDIVPGAASSAPGEIAAAGAYVYFLAGDPVHGRELWRTDGTDAGTILLRDLTPGTAGSEIGGLTAVGNRLYFTAPHTTGRALWRSDGTVASTQFVAALGSSVTVAQQLYSIDGTLYFAADNGTHGLELWKTTAAGGLAMVADLEPGAGGSWPEQLVRAGNLIFFAATTSAFGRELWALPLTGTSLTTLSIGDVRVTEGHSGTRTATLTVTRGGDTSSAVSAAFATSNASAAAGTDYTAASGTVSFAAGEIVKTIAVSVLGDTAIENDESLLVTLSSPSGAVLARGMGTVMVEDDDRRAELKIEWLPTQGFSMSRERRLRVTNDGPSTATGLALRYSESPYVYDLEVTSLGSSPTHCTSTENPIRCPMPSLAPGASIDLLVSADAIAGWLDPAGPPGHTAYASVSASEGDTKPADNTAGRMISHHGSLMLPPFLTSGTSATATATMGSPAPSDHYIFSLLSSDANVSVSPPEVRVPVGETSAQFTVASGASAGTTRLSLYLSQQFHGAMVVPVAAPGTTPKLDVAIAATNARVTYGQSAQLVAKVAAVRHDGTRPSGTLSLLDESGNVLATQPLDANASATFSRGNLNPGVHRYSLRYGGDASFNALAGAPVIAEVTGWETETEVRVPPLVCGSADVIVTVRNVDTDAMPAGSVVIHVGNAIVATVPLQASGVAGEARATYRHAFAASDFYISASYEPSGTFEQSSDARHFLSANCSAALNVRATATFTPGRISIAWHPNGAHHYDVLYLVDQRNWAFAGTTTGGGIYHENVPADRVYLYTVRAMDAAGNTLSWSPPDIATTVTFSNDPPVSGVTRLAAVHLQELQKAATELRWLVDGQRPELPLVISGGTVRAAHFTELRTRINDARRALGLPPFPFTGEIAPGMPVRFQPVQELRNAIK